MRLLCLSARHFDRQQNQKRLSWEESYKITDSLTNRGAFFFGRSVFLAKGKAVVTAALGTESPF